MSWCALALEHSPSRPLAHALVALAVPMHCCRLGPAPLLAPPSPLPFLSRWKSGGENTGRQSNGRRRRGQGRRRLGRCCYQALRRCVGRRRRRRLRRLLCSICRRRALLAVGQTRRQRHALGTRQRQATGGDGTDELAEMPETRCRVGRACAPCAHHVAHAPEQARNRRATGDAEQVDVRHGAHGGTSTCCMGDAEYAAGGACGCAAT